MIDFSMDSIQNALYDHHPQLMNRFCRLTFDENNAYAHYLLSPWQLNKYVTVTIDRHGNVNAPSELMTEMDLNESQCTQDYIAWRESWMKAHRHLEGFWQL